MGAGRRVGEHQSPRAREPFHRPAWWPGLSGQRYCRARPAAGNAIGLLLVAFGFIWYLRNWSALGIPGLADLGAVSGYLGPPLLVQITLAYPTGRLRSAFDRFVVGIVYAVAGVASLIGLLEFSPRGAGCATCAWEPALFPSRAAYLATAPDYQRASLVLAVLVVVAAWRRSYRATRAERRDLAAWWIALRLLGAVFVLGAFSSPFPDRNSFPYLLWELQSVLLASLPAIFVWGLLSARLAHSAVSDLVLELQGPLPPGGLQDSLARAIGDPSLTLAYARDGRQDGWVDLCGRPSRAACAGGRASQGGHGGRAGRAPARGADPRSCPGTWPGQVGRSRGRHGYRERAAAGRSSCPA